MTNPVQAAAQDLETALSGVEGLRYYPLGSNVDPPGLVMGPPALTWEAYCLTPTTATFPVFLVTALDDRALEQLFQYVVPVSEALEAVTDAAVQNASPGTYLAGTQELPCYTLSVEVAL